MLCLRCSRGLSTLVVPSIASRAVQRPSFKASAQRTFTSLATRRPTIFHFSINPSLSISPSLVSTDVSAETSLDIFPKISRHPALSSTQIRCGPRNTFSPSHFVRKRRHGFLSRIRTRKGRATLERRRAKKRGTLSH
ncbi:hypothetical protein OIDMADRAFT_158610 [Oidiodendron maius Zn]|uniref:Ribosomal protein L34 n=1 Tax=Oidiodendron maius (strain Zn) TaxID=913774 RepID=A0A0C3CXP0_OIDMZ|nr:hypothetical protein OIDMADRAFT_158610 [Oidiodendron maius Zn]